MCQFCFPASDKRIEQIKEEQGKDEICQQLVEYRKHGWARKSKTPHVLKPFQEKLSYKMDL